MIPQEFEASALKKVAQRHVHRFERRLNSGSPNVRVDECSRYLDIWKDILDSVNMWPLQKFPMVNFKPNERNEVIDAFVSGEFDEDEQ